MFNILFEINVDANIRDLFEIKYHFQFFNEQQFLFLKRKIIRIEKYCIRFDIIFRLRI